MGRFNFLSQIWRSVSPYPVHGGDNGVEFRPFFILSAGRSGSTLLRAILMQHPTVSIPPESFVLGRVVKRFQQDYSRLDWRLCARLVASEFATGVDFQYWNIPLDKFIQQAEKIPTDKRNLAFLVDQLYQFYASHHKPEATRWGDKSTNNILFIDALLKVYPQARFIHLIRDGRDVVASRLARGWHTDVNLACDMWLKLVGHGLDTPIRDHEGSFLEVRYEELVSEAEVVVPQIADFLGLSFVPEMLQPQKIVHTLGDADRAIHEHLNEPISPAHIGKWRQILSPADQLVVQERLGAVLISLGYDI